MPETNKPIRWNLDFMGIVPDLEKKQQTRDQCAEQARKNATFMGCTLDFEKIQQMDAAQRRDLERLAGIIDGAGLAVDYAYDMLDERRTGTELDKAFRRAIRALDKLSKALEAESDGGKT
jgi:hypothetical protein